MKNLCEMLFCIQIEMDWKWTSKLLEKLFVFLLFYFREDWLQARVVIYFLQFFWCWWCDFKIALCFMIKFNNPLENVKISIFIEEFKHSIESKIIFAKQLMLILVHHSSDLNHCLLTFIAHFYSERLMRRYYQR